MLPILVFSFSLLHSVVVVEAEERHSEQTGAAVEEGLQVEEVLKLLEEAGAVLEAHQERRVQEVEADRHQRSHSSYRQNW